MFNIDGSVTLDEGQDWIAESFSDHAVPQTSCWPFSS